MAIMQTDRILTGVDPSVDAVLTAKLDASIRVLLDSGKTDAIEELIMGRIESDPFDLRFFVPVIRYYVRNDKTETAEMFVDLLRDAYRERNAEKDEPQLLSILFSVWPESPVIQKEISKLLAAMFGQRPNFKRLAEFCKIRETQEPYIAFRRFESWLRFDEGSIVYFPAKGAGQVREINPGLNAVRVKFTDADLLSFKIEEAERNLETLPPDHFLSVKIEKPEDLRRLAKNDGVGLLHRLFSSINRQIPVHELRDMLAGLVEPDDWSSWWNDARKDRRLTVSKDSLCSWNDSGDEADSTLLAHYMVSSIPDQLVMIKNHSRRSPAIAAAMQDRLFNEASAQISANPSIALEILLSLDKLSAAGLPDRKQLIDSIISRNDAAAVISAIQDRVLRKKAITLIREQRTDWATIFRSLLITESDNGSLTFMYEALGLEDGPLLEFVKDVFRDPVTAPHFFVWLCREIAARTELHLFADWSFIQTIIHLLAKNTIKDKNASLKKLFDDDGAVCFAARKLSIDQVKQFITLLERDSSLEDYRKDKMSADLRAWFPQTQEIEDKTFYVSPAALAQRQTEFTKITTVDIPENTEEIIKARAHGDLKENFEYHAARTRQEMLSSRAKTLHDQLQCARPIDRIKVDPSSICVGTTCLLAAPDDGETVAITILGPWDSDPSRNIISYLAPAGNALLGKCPGDSIVYNNRLFVIQSVEPWKSVNS